MLQLYTYYRSSAAYRVRIALHYKGVPFDQVSINILAKEQFEDAFLDVSSQDLVPALKLEDGTVLTQSMAILEWLEEQNSGEPLYPTEPLERAQARAMVNTIAFEIHPVNNLRVLRYLKQNSGVSDGEKRIGITIG